jgi:hypothetical protein
MLNHLYEYGPQFPNERKGSSFSEFLQGLRQGLQVELPLLAEL